MLSQISSLTDLLMRAGISGYDRETRRRLSIVNLAGYCAAASSVSFAINFALHDARNLMPLIIGNLVSAVITASAPFWHRFNSVLAAAIMSFTVAFSLFWFVSMLGTDTGVHLNYIGGPAIAFAIFGLHHLRMIVLIGAICIGANIAAEFMFATGSLQHHMDAGFLRQIYILSAASIIIIVSLIVWYGFSIADDAERRSEQLLLNIFPPRIADELRYNPDKQIADRFDEATVMFADIVGFTEMTSNMEPDELVTMLDQVFSEFDARTASHRAEKIKTIGDEYMAVCGAPDLVDDHARRVVDLAVDLQAAARDLSESTGLPLQLRIGIATGPITAGVIGKTKFAYDVWATTVNLAARLQSSAANGSIHVCGATRIATRGHHSFTRAPAHNLKGIASQQTWVLEN